jgi:hypothetical protein
MARFPVPATGNFPRTVRIRIRFCAPLKTARQLASIRIYDSHPDLIASRGRAGHQECMRADTANRLLKKVIKLNYHRGRGSARMDDDAPVLLLRFNEDSANAKPHFPKMRIRELLPVYLFVVTAAVRPLRYVLNHRNVKVRRAHPHKGIEHSQGFVYVWHLLLLPV